jgi:hypothetical protein
MMKKFIQFELGLLRQRVGGEFLNWADIVAVSVGSDFPLIVSEEAARPSGRLSAVAAVVNPVAFNRPIDGPVPSKLNRQRGSTFYRLRCVERVRHYGLMTLTT